MKKGAKIGDKILYDMEKLYGRMLVVSRKRKLDLEKVFGYELAPLPSSLFDELGEMRKGKKAILVSKLAIFTISFVPDVSIIDGNAQLHHITWPKSGTATTFATNFVKGVKDDQEVLVVFDRYRPDSIKTQDWKGVRQVSVDLICSLM